jgi:hypothetical protein
MSSLLFALLLAVQPVISDFGNLQIETLETSKGHDMLLTPIEEAASYRAYSFSERGLFQVFNHYDYPGVTEEMANGSRSFFLFPRKQIPTFKTPDSSGNIQVITSSGEAIDVLPAGPRMETAASSALQVSEASDIDPTNSGGVSVTLSPSAQMLLLDTGFSIDGVAFTQPNGVSTFIDSIGGKCALINSELFSFSDDDADLKFRTDAALYEYLKNACPQLKVPSID